MRGMDKLLKASRYGLTDRAHPLLASGRSWPRVRPRFCGHIRAVLPRRHHGDALAASKLAEVVERTSERAQELTNLIDAADTKAQSQLFTGTGGVLDMDDARLAGAAGVSSDTS